MRATPLLLAIALLTPAPLTAQVGKKAADKQSDVKQEYQKLVDQFDAASKEYRDQVQALSKTPEFQELVKKRDREGMAKLQATIDNPLPGFVKKFEAAAEKHAKHPDGAWFLAWVASNSGEQDTVREAIKTLSEKHVQSPAMELVAQRAMILTRQIGADETNELLGKLIDENPHKLVKANALFTRGTMVARNRNASAEDKEAAQKDLDQVADLAPGTLIALKATGPRFEKERLQIGMEAPDIVGEDLDGVSFKLSDYKGKVVVLDFWGDW